MNNWYTVATAFLGGAVIGLLAFLFYQPANTTKDRANSTDRQVESDLPDAPASDSVTETKQNEADDQKTEEAGGDPSTSESWEKETDTSTATPRLIFYYKPG